MARLATVVVVVVAVIGPITLGQNPDTLVATPVEATGQGRVVQRGDTLMTLSREWLSRYAVEGVSVTLSQVMIGIYRANPQAFGRDMNDLLIGSPLVLPALASVQQIPRGEALQEVRTALGIWVSPVATEAPMAVAPPAPAAEPGTMPVMPPVMPIEERLSRLEAELKSNQRRLDALVQQDQSRAGLFSQWWWVLLGVPVVVAAATYGRKGPKSNRPVKAAPLVAVRLPAPNSQAIDDLEGDPPLLQEARSLIDLARAYVEMGDTSAARQELTRALELGDEAEREEVRRLLDTLPSA